MKTLTLRTLLALTLLLAASSAQAVITIDTFDDAEVSVANSGSTSPDVQNTPTGSFVGLNRQMYAEWLSGPNSVVVEIDAGGSGLYNFSAGADTRGRGSVVWGGLGGLDLSAGGTLNGFAIWIPFNDLPAQISFYVADSSFRVSEMTLTTAGGIFAPTQMAFLFSSFSSFSGDADFTDVEAIQMDTFSLFPFPATNLQIGLVEVDTPGANLLLRSYHETFDGESAFPTSPEVDLLDAGGLLGFASNAAFLTFTGTAARATLGYSISSFPTASIPLGFPLPPASVGTNAFRSRHTFDNYSASGLSGGEETFARIEAAFEPDEVTVELRINDAGTSRILLTTPTGGGSVQLSAAAETAVLGGAEFALEIRLDRNFGQVSSALEVEGVGRIDGPGSQVELGAQRLHQLFTLFGVEGEGPGAQVTLDTTEIELFLEGLEGARNVPAAGPIARGVLVLALLALPRWARKWRTASAETSRAHLSTV